ncbi:hypothetical protein AKO1_002135, partial [Acrasis kona]
KKLNKAQIVETDIADSVDNIVEPVVPISLRTSGHLMLGVVKIYSRKVRFILKECKEVETRIKLQIVPETKVDLAENRNTAPVNTITLPDRTNEIDLMMPDIDLTLLVNPAALSQVPYLDQVQDFVMSEEFEWREDNSANFVPSAQTPTQATPIVDTPGIETTTPSGLDTDVYNQPIADLPPLDFDDNNFGGGGDFGLETPPGTPGPGLHEESPAPTEREQGGAEDQQEPKQQQQEEEEEEEEAPAAGNKRKRGIVLDKQTRIPPAKFTKLLADTSNIVRVPQRAPATREEFDAYQAQPRNLFKEPNLPPHLINSEYAKLYAKCTSRYNAREDPTSEAFLRARNLPDAAPAARDTPVPATPAGDVVGTPGPVTPAGSVAPDSVEQNRERITEMDEPGGFGGFDDNFEFEPTAATPGGDVDTPEVSRRKSRKSLLQSPLQTFDVDIQDRALEYARRKSGIIEEQRSLEQRRREKQAQHEQLKSAYKGKNITDSTIQIMGVLQEHFKKTGDDSLVLQELTQDMKRTAAARCFYETLVMKTRNLINVDQPAPFDPITIVNKAIDV